MLKTQQNECYVLITCAKPKKGEMQVELTFEGDRDLAYLLIGQAEKAMDDCDEAC